MLLQYEPYLRLGVLNNINAESIKQNLTGKERMEIAVV